MTLLLTYRLGHDLTHNETLVTREKNNNGWIKPLGNIEA